MTDHIHDLGAGFRNIRGTFRRWRAKYRHSMLASQAIIRKIYLFGQLRPHG